MPAKLRFAHTPVPECHLGTRAHHFHAAPENDSLHRAARRGGHCLDQISRQAQDLPPAGLEAQGTLQEAPRLRYEYNPHLPPVLRSATDAAEADKLPELLVTARQRALSAEEAKVLADALRRHEPWLEWSGKREKPWFEVEPVALHMHERISTQAILRVLAREDVERDLFADPQHDYAKAVQFYQHDVDWATRSRSWPASPGAKTSRARCR